MLRIIAGKYKGFRLNLVPSTRTKTTSHLVRKALFDTLGDALRDNIVLDLFSGSGAYGFEALSRNAKVTYLVDHFFLSFQTMKKNQQKLNLSDEKVKIFYGDAFRMLKKFIQNNLLFDLIILDPPYFYNRYISLFQYLDQITTEKSWVICEINHKSCLPIQINNFHLTKNKKYGSKKINFYRKI